MSGVLPVLSSSFRPGHQVLDPVRPQIRESLMEAPDLPSVDYIGQFSIIWNCEKSKCNFKTKSRVSTIFSIIRSRLIVPEKLKP